MPIELKPKTSKAEEEAPKGTKGLVLFKEDGDLTLAGETIADFLEAADFSAVTTSEDARPFLFNPAITAEDPYALDEEGEGDEEDGDEDDTEDDGDEEDEKKAPAEKDDDADDADDDGADADDDGADAEPAEDDEPVAEVALPGEVAARLVDEADLTEMFGYYLDRLAAVDEPTLQEQAVLAVFADYRDEDGGIAEDKRDAVAALLKAVLCESFICDAAEEIDEKFLSKGQRLKVARIRKKPKTGARRRLLKKRRREEKRGAKKAKIGRQRKAFKRRRKSRLKFLAREGAEPTKEEQLVFGYGDGIDGANFKVGVAESPDLAFTRDDLIAFDVMAGSVFDCPSDTCESSHPFAAYIAEAMHKKKNGKKNGDHDEEEEDDDENGESSHKKKGKKYESFEGACPDCGEEIESMLDEKGKIPPAFLKNMKGKKKDKNGKDDDGDDDKKKKGNPFGKKKDESARVSPSHVPGAFAVAAGRPNLSEGHSLAAATLGVLGHRTKPLTEDRD